MRHIALIAAVLLGLALLLRTGMLLAMAALLFLVLVVAEVWIHRVVDRLSVRRRFDDHAFLGETVTVELTLQNGSRLPVPWAELSESVPMAKVLPAAHREVVALGPLETHVSEYEIECRRRGYHAVGPLSVETGDPFGIVRRAPRRLPSRYLVVYPKIVPMEELGLPARAPWALVPAPIALLEDPTRVLGVRDYRAGDSPRRIHWRATARNDRLLVKQFQPGIARETLICLDLDRDAYTRGERVAASEHAIVVAASVAHHSAIREGLPVGLLTEAVDPLIGERATFFLPPRPERRHLMTILEVLARAQVVPSTHPAELLRVRASKLTWGSTILAVSGRADRELLGQLYVLRRSGFAVALILVGRGGPEGAADFDIPVHRLDTERALTSWS